MSNWRNILGRLARMPRGCAADGRMLGLATTAAIEAQRRAANAEAAAANRRQATAMATESSHRMEQAEHGRHPG